MRNNMPLDIRGHQDWMATAHTLKTVEELRRVLRARRWRPSAARRTPGFQDLNQDGSRDIRDLAEMKERVYRIEDTDGDGFADQSHGRHGRLQRTIRPGTSSAASCITTAT